LDLRQKRLLGEHESLVAFHENTKYQREPKLTVVPNKLVGGELQPVKINGHEPSYERRTKCTHNNGVALTCLLSISITRKSKKSTHAPAKISSESTTSGRTLVPSTSITVKEWLSMEKIKLGSQEMETKRSR